MPRERALAEVTDSPAEAWLQLREEVGDKLHGNMYSSVPLLQEAKTFDMLTVYVKRTQSGGCLARLCSSCQYQMVGWLRDLLQVHKCTAARLRSLLPRQLPIKVGGDAVFQFTTQNVKLDREAIIRIYNLSIETSDVVSILPGEIYVNNSSPVLQNVETMYVLSEVIFCRRFYFFLRFEKREIILNLPYNRLPIAFRSVKFVIRHDGGLVLTNVAKIRNKPSVKWAACGTWNDNVIDNPPLPVTISNLKVVEYSRKTMRVEPATTSSATRPLRYAFPQPDLKNPDADLSRDHKASPLKIISEAESAESVASLCCITTSGEEIVRKSSCWCK